MSSSRKRMYRRRRRTVALGALLAVTTIVLANHFAAADAEHDTAASTAHTAVPRAAPTGSVPVLRPELPRKAAPTRKPPTGPAAPATTAGRFSYAAGQGPVVGLAGTLKRFRVAVELGAGEDPTRFAAVVERILGDPRGWIASGRLRFQRVPANGPADFTIELASPGTSERICATGGLRTNGYSSCRLAGRVVINLARWQRGVPNYGAPLTTYQAYAINHEVGHELGHGHEACTGQGKPAPVMQQQTYGLKGCVANPWPYVDGERYAGRPI